MDENKIVRLFNYTSEKEDKPLNIKTSSFSMHTNPIIQRLFVLNSQNKKDKFKFKDLFR